MHNSTKIQTTLEFNGYTVNEINVQSIPCHWETVQPKTLKVQYNWQESSDRRTIIIQHLAQWTKLMSRVQYIVDRERLNNRHKCSILLAMNNIQTFTSNTQWTKLMSGV